MHTLRLLSSCCAVPVTATAAAAQRSGGTGGGASSPAQHRYALPHEPGTATSSLCEDGVSCVFVCIGFCLCVVFCLFSGCWYLMFRGQDLLMVFVVLFSC